MTNTDITPEILRAVAEWTEHRTSIGSYTISRVLRKEAANLEREHADEKRIDELARISFDAEHAYASAERPSSTLIDWDGSSEFQRNIARAGIRAVLDKLRIDSYTSPCDGKCGDISPHNGHLTPEGRRHFLAEPRTWAQIEDVPGDVGVVMNAYRDRIRRDPETAYGWRFIWDGGGDRAPVPRGSLAEHGPYTEVIADD